MCLCMFVSFFLHVHLCTRGCPTMLVCLYLWFSACCEWDLHVFVPTSNLACTVMSPKFTHQRNKAKGMSGCKSVPQEPWNTDTDVWNNKRVPQLNTILYGSKDEWTLLTHAESDSSDAKLAKIPQTDGVLLFFFFFSARLCVGGSTFSWMK